MPTGNVRIVNRDRDLKHFELEALDADGKPKRDAAGRIVKELITLGSLDDDRVEGAPQPEIEISAANWDRLSKQKAVAGMVDSRAIAIYPL